MARKKANNRMLVILLALIAVVCVALWYACLLYTSDAADE